MPDKLIQKYFFTNYSDEQLFAVVFAHWYGLEENKIKLISNRNYLNYCYWTLACFLKGAAFEDVKQILKSRDTKEERIKKLKMLVSEKKYYISIDNKFLHAVCQDTNFLVTNAGEMFEIDYHYLHDERLLNESAEKQI